MSDTLRLSANKPEDIRVAAALLKGGQIAAIPTETVYGLAANALDPKAVAAIFAAKGRPQDNPLIVHIASAADAAPLVSNFSEEAQKLAAAFWPGPLTIILPKSDVIPPIVSAGLQTVALRVPAHPAARALLKACGLPLAAPSANRSGKPSPTTAEHVLNDLNGRIAAVLDGGACDIGVESTVLSLAGETPMLLRPGGISREVLRDLLGMEIALPQKLRESEAPPSPGMKYKHYAPNAQLMLLDCNIDDFAAKVKNIARQGDAVLCFDEDIGALAFLGIPLLTFGGIDDPRAQARLLFARLREMDERGFTRVFCRVPQGDGIGAAVLNRLARASFSEEKEAKRLSPLRAEFDSTQKFLSVYKREREATARRRREEKEAKRLSPLRAEPESTQKFLSVCKREREAAARRRRAEPESTCVIGLVGKTGAGKSTAATLLAQMGCTVIDADKIARELTQPNAPILQTLADVFGKDILANGILNRALLASRAFADETARQKLNAVMHPAVMARITEMIDALPRGATAVIDAAALLETALKPDHLIVIDASEEIRLRRVMVRDGITAESAMERIRAQKNLVFPNENTAFRTIIQNDDLPIGELKIQLKEALQRMVFAKTSAPTWLVVGLGNPGKQYEYTRHNAGFLCLDLLANNCGAKINKLKFHALHGFCDLNGTRCLLLRPQTFMNNSGLAVREAAAYFDIPPARVLVLFDDISLPCGGLRIRRGGSDGGHNGIKSMIAALDTNAFPRVKIGVGNRPHPDFDLIDWVLSVMTTSERAQLREACEKAADAAKLIVSDNMEAAMAKYNAKCQD